MDPTSRTASAKQVPMVGRYEVAGRIATGGMAEIFLGRLAGPSGFERPVALKRILPHLVDETSFVDMFVDEARIAARIQHPNVVQVHELGRDAGELFLAMEYLEGETLSGLSRRLAARGERLPADLAAYIVSEAAAGLHAAHELRDDEGELVELVHRDVSPQNLFVGYRGNIKVLDFGVAKAAGRLTHTGHGELKGKLCYMSPEQIENAILDRRSDVFALGVVLYEILAGRRLFKRDSAGATMRAIVQGEIPPLTTFVDDIDPELEAACLSALLVNRDERTPTAAQLRQELSLVLARHTDRGLPEKRLADLMQELFAERADEKREMLRRMRDGSSVTSVPAGEVDVSVEVPTVAHDSTPKAVVVTEEPLGSRRGALMAAAAVALLGLAGLWASGVWDAEPTARSSVPTAASLSSSAEPEAPPEVEPAQPQPAEAPASMVTISLDSEPAGATVLRGEETLGTTPVEVEFPRSDAPVPLTFRLEGHRDATQTVIPNLPSRLQVALRRRRRPRPAHTPSPPAETGFRRFQ